MLDAIALYEFIGFINVASSWKRRHNGTQQELTIWKYSSNFIGRASPNESLKRCSISNYLNRKRSLPFSLTYCDFDVVSQKTHRLCQIVDGLPGFLSILVVRMILHILIENLPRRTKRRFQFVSRITAHANSNSTVLVVVEGNDELRHGV